MQGGLAALGRVHLCSDPGSRGATASPQPAFSRTAGGFVATEAGMNLHPFRRFSEL